MATLLHRSHIKSHMFDVVSIVLISLVGEGLIVTLVRIATGGTKIRAWKVSAVVAKMKNACVE